MELRAVVVVVVVLLLLLLWLSGFMRHKDELELGEVRAVSSHRSDGIRRIECVTVSS